MRKKYIQGSSAIQWFIE